jgi:ABC-type uncharacterized transport system involved in gliding motility auxiliary subunit
MVEKKRSAGYIKFFIYLVIIFLINAAGVTLFFRVDLTEDKIYSISEASKRVVSTLSEPLTIEVFFTKNLPAPHNNTERYLRDLLEEYSINANQYFNYRFYDVSAEEGDVDQKTLENRQLAESYGIYPVRVQTIEKEEVKFQKAYMGLVLLHGDVIETMPSLTSTDKLEYRLTMTIQKLNDKISALVGLEDKIKLKLFLSSSLEPVAPYMRLNQLPEIPKTVEDIVKELNAKTYGKLTYEYLDPTKDKSLEAELEKYNIRGLQWPDLLDGKIKSGKGAIGLVMEHGKKAVQIPLIRITRIPLVGTRYELVDLKKMKADINEHIESILEINEDIGYLSDHRTLRLLPQVPQGGYKRPDAVSNLRAIITETYNLKYVKVKDGPVPESLNCLIIAAPQEPFNDYELFQIDQFLMRGKNLAIFVDGYKASQEEGMENTYVATDLGLSKLMEHYGLRVKQSMVMDESCYIEKRPEDMGGGQGPIHFVPIIKNQFINQDLKFMHNIKGFAVSYISPLELITERITENGLKAYKVFSSSDKSWEMSGEQIFIHPLLIRPPESESEDVFTSQPLAYILEGKFPSYFAGKPIPEKPDQESGKSDSKKAKEGEEDKEESDIDLSKIKSSDQVLSEGKPGKIFFIASTGVLKDNILDAKGESTNSTLIMNLLDYLNNREDIAVMRSKVHGFNPLYDIEAGTKIFAKFFNIAGLPILTVLFGLLFWLHRHYRKRRIKTMFKK